LHFLSLPQHTKTLLGLLFLMPLSTIFQFYPGGQFFIGGGNQSTRKKINDLSQVPDKLLSHNGISSTPHLSGIRTHNVSGDRH